MGNSLYQKIKFYSWLITVTITKLVIFYFFYGFSITNNEEQECTTLNHFESTEYSIGKDLTGLDPKKAIYFALFVLSNTLLVAMIFIFIKVNVVCFKRKKSSNKVNWENALLLNGLPGKSQSN